MRRIMTAGLAIALGYSPAAPAGAQVFWKSRPLNTAPATGLEPELAINLPGATPGELRAGMVWHLRAALNVAALQCDFEPALLTVSNYNAAIAHHKDELTSAFVTLRGYFERTIGKGRGGQNALDQYGTRVYSSYSAVQALKPFCQAAGFAGRDAIFADRGGLYEVARLRLPDLRGAFKGPGELQFTNPAYAYRATLPSMNEKCWKRDELTSTCRAQWDAALRSMR